jgi:hypothetical protein
MLPSAPTAICVHSPGQQNRVFNGLQSYRCDVVLRLAGHKSDVAEHGKAGPSGPGLSAGERRESGGKEALRAEAAVQAEGVRGSKMNDRRRKFIGEIAGLAKLVSALPAPFQSHILDLAGDMAADPECFEAHRRLYQDQPLPVREEAGRVRTRELADFMASGVCFEPADRGPPII